MGWLETEIKLCIIDNFQKFVRVQRSLIFQPDLWASWSQDVLARRSFLLPKNFQCFTVLLLINFKEKFPQKTFTCPSGK